MRKESLVTVLLPAYNAEQYIEASIKSILNQTYKAFELLIIDDGSDDGTGQIANSFHDDRVRYVRNETNIGLIRTLNKGLVLAKSDLIARQDADDISYPDRLAKQVAYMLENKKTALLGTQGRVIDDNGKAVYVGFFDKPQTPVGIRWRLCFENAFIHTSVMFRKKIILDEFQGYKEFTSLESRSPAQDFELWSRVSRDRKVANLPDILVDRREHPQAISSNLNGEKGRIAQKGNLEIVTNNIRNIFGPGMYSEDQIKFILQFRCAGADNDYIKFLDLLDDMMNKYVALFPEANRCVEFTEGVAMQLSNVAYSYLGKNNLAAIKIYAKSAKRSPRIIVRWPWTKILFLIIFGERSRKIYGYWKKLVA